MFVAWESRKRSVNLTKQQSVNISLPFSFIDLHKKIRGFAVEVAVKKYNDENVRWSAQVGARGQIYVSKSLKL